VFHYIQSAFLFTVCYINILCEGKSVKFVIALCTAENHRVDCGTGQCVRYVCTN